jgi:hypothetical protein
MQDTRQTAGHMPWLDPTGTAYLQVLCGGSRYKQEKEISGVFEILRTEHSVYGELTREEIQQIQQYDFASNHHLNDIK